MNNSHVYWFFTGVASTCVLGLATHGDWVGAAFGAALIAGCIWLGKVEYSREQQKTEQEVK